ncbi:MAG: hypothetical protein KAS72_10515 [Phycisphaerales bacterium]|nr:hypothetical protein [Phycisphaerales bacterium]
MTIMRSPSEVRTGVVLVHEYDACHWEVERKTMCRAVDVVRLTGLCCPMHWVTRLLRNKRMEYLWIVGFVVAWFVLQRWVLPSMGVKT